MERSDRRNLSELKTLYTLFPDIRDVIVEGREDAKFFRWYFREVGENVARVYPVDDRANIPAEEVDRIGADHGNKGRVMAVAARAEEWNLGTPSLTAIVDMDRDAVTTHLTPDGLLRTDVGSVDAYSLAPRPLAKFFDLVAGVDADPDEVISALVPELNDLYAVRSSLHLVGVPVIQDFSRLFGTARTGPSADTEQLIRRSLAARGRGADYALVMAELDRIRAVVSSLAPLTAVRGHDIAPLLIRWLGLKNDWARYDVVEKSLRACLTVEDLEGQGMFIELGKRLGWGSHG